jgi:hypothetical protein
MWQADHTVICANGQVTWQRSNCVAVYELASLAGTFVCAQGDCAATSWGPCYATAGDMPELCDAGGGGCPGQEACCPDASQSPSSASTSTSGSPYASPSPSSASPSYSGSYVTGDVDDFCYSIGCQEGPPRSACVNADDNGIDCCPALLWDWWNTVYNHSCGDVCTEILHMWRLDNDCYGPFLRWDGNEWFICCCCQHDPPT